MKRFWISSILLMSFSLVFCGKVPTALGTEGLQPLEQSQAFQDFLKKPANNFSKLVCVLNYMRTAPVKVQYEGIDYAIEGAYSIGLVYLMTNYHNENPEQWIRKNSYRSLFKNQIIYIKLPNGRYVPARDVLLEKFRELEAALTAQAPKA
jgi:hypothetical protein